MLSHLTRYIYLWRVRCQSEDMSPDCWATPTCAVRLRESADPQQLTALESWTDVLFCVLTQLVHCSFIRRLWRHLRAVSPPTLPSSHKWLISFVVEDDLQRHLQGRTSFRPMSKFHPFGLTHVVSPAHRRNESCHIPTNYPDSIWQKAMPFW